MHQRRTSNSPTIDDDFTIDSSDDEEPFDEPRVTPKAIRRAIVQAEIDGLEWNASALDSNSMSGDDATATGAATTTAAVHKSYLDASMGPTNDQRNDFVDQRDDHVFEERRDDTQEFREAPKMMDRQAADTALKMMSQNRGKQSNGMKKARKSLTKTNVTSAESKKQQGVQFQASSASSKQSDNDNAIRRERSMDGEDEKSAFSLAPSVAVSVTRRISNTTNLLSPKGNSDDDKTLLTADIAGGNCFGSKKTKKSSVAEDLLKEEDMLDTFFEGVEGKICPTPSARKSRKTKEEEGLARLLSPILTQLEKFDGIFEHLEEFACPNDDDKTKNDKDKDDTSKISVKTPAPISANTTVSTPVGFAAAKFSQLLDQVEKFDPGFVKSKANCGEEMAENVDDNMSQATGTSSINSPRTALKKAFQRAEQEVKDQREYSYEKKTEIEKLKAQFFAARLNLKLQQQILTEAVKQNTANAAQKTTTYLEQLSGCHPVVSSCQGGNDSDIVVDNTDAEPRQVDSLEYEAESDMFYDAVSVDTTSDVYSMASASEHSNIRSHIMTPSDHSKARSNIAATPSEHSNIHSSRRFARTNVLNAATEDETSGRSKSYSDHVLRSPHNLSTSTRFSNAIANTPGPLLGAIAEELSATESSTSASASKHNGNKVGNQKSKSDHRRWSSHGRYPDTPSNPKELAQKWVKTAKSVYDASGKIINKAQCTSASIDITGSDSNLGDEQDQKQTELQNSMIEEDGHNVSAMAKESEKKIDQKECTSKACENDDQSDFETAADTMGDLVEHDLRPPMLRLQQLRSESRSQGSRENASLNGSLHEDLKASIDSRSKSGSGSVHSRLSSELPEGYTLVDSIRHASLSAQTSGANRTKPSKEPRGNKVKNSASVHIRKTMVPPPLLPPRPQLDPDENLKPQSLKSPKSSETNETSDLTAVSGSSSGDLHVSHLEDSTHSRKMMVIHVEDTKEPPSDDATVNTYSTDGDQKTVTSHNTNNTGSTGSTDFRDCYQDAIPSLSTMGTVREDDVSTIASAPKKVNRKDIVMDPIPDNMAVPSDTNIVKSMALLSVSATVLKNTKDTRIPEESEEYEVESVPSTSIHSRQEDVEEPVEEYVGDSSRSLAKGRLTTLHEVGVEESCTEEEKTGNALMDQEDNSLESVQSQASEEEEGQVEGEDITVDSNEIELNPVNSNSDEVALNSMIGNRMESTTQIQGSSANPMNDHYLQQPTKNRFHGSSANPMNDQYLPPMIAQFQGSSANPMNDHYLEPKNQIKGSSANPMNDHYLEPINQIKGSSANPRNDHYLEPAKLQSIRDARIAALTQQPNHRTQGLLLVNPMTDNDHYLAQPPKQQLEDIYEEESESQFTEELEQPPKQQLEDICEEESESQFTEELEQPPKQQVEDVCEEESESQFTEELEQSPKQQLEDTCEEESESLCTEEMFQHLEEICEEESESESTEVSDEPPKLPIISRKEVQPTKLEGICEDHTSVLTTKSKRQELNVSATTKKITAKLLEEPRTIAERRRRRLKQRKKFAKVLRGEDDSSSCMSSSTLTDSSDDLHRPFNNNIVVAASASEESSVEQEEGPLFSESFDTGYGEQQKV